jgi:hypothetical protein
MTDYTRIEKETNTYSKVDKRPGKGWFDLGWFLDWFQETLIYRKVAQSGKRLDEE